MDRSEPSFIPGWLKGTPTGGLASQNLPEEGGSSMTSTNQPSLVVGNNLDSLRKSTSSGKVFSCSSRRSSDNGTLDRPVSERDRFGGLVRSKSNLNRISSIRSQGKYNLEQNGYKLWLDGESALEVDRRKEWLPAMVPERERDGESVVRQFSPGSPSGKYEIASKMKRSQSMGVSTRLESGSGKLTEMALMMASANGYPATNLQKTGFGHNFPSVVLEDRPSSPRLSVGNIASPRPSVTNSNHVWQGISRSDLSRASSPGLMASSPGLEGGYVNPVSASTGGADLWSSALADGPTPHSIVQSRNVASNAVYAPSTSQTSASVVHAANVPSANQASGSVVHGPVTSVTALNMAEALTQNPPRVRTPPQLSVESQRLEELALKQSRQLIPVTPSLPKIMSLGDKGKSKTPRAVDSSANSKSQLSVVQKSAAPSSRAPDTMKPSQRELCVLRPGRDGVVVTASSKSDGTAVGNSGPAAVSTGSSIGVSVPPVGGGHGQPKMGLSLHAQNRSDFFNALRRKAAGNGVANTSGASEAQNGTADVDVEATKGQGNGVGEDVCPSPSGQTREDAAVVGSGGSSDLLSCESSKDERIDQGLEAEEAAFLRSLGWEENAEDSELTEEEINEFVESLPASQREKLFNGKGHHRYGPCAVVGNIGNMSSELACSD